MSDLRHRFATLLRHHRGERDHVVVAKAIGANRDHMLGYETGGMLPPLPVYVRLCKWYGLTLAQRAELDELAAGMGVGS